MSCPSVCPSFSYLFSSTTEPISPKLEGMWARGSSNYNPSQNIPSSPICRHHCSYCPDAHEFDPYLLPIFCLSNCFLLTKMLCGPIKTGSDSGNIFAVRDRRSGRGKGILGKLKGEGSLDPGESGPDRIGGRRERVCKQVTDMVGP